MRKYRILFIDDEKELINQIIEAVKIFIATRDGIDLEFEVLSDKESIEKMNDIAADIVLFDCALYGTDLDYTGVQASAYGIELMRKFREKNKKTKIIFYSGGFSLSGSQCYEFVHEEVLQLINDIHIYKLIPKKAEYIADAVKEAIDELDAVIISLEDLKEEYNSTGEFLVNNQRYPIENMIAELKKGTDVGNEFRNAVFKMVLTYLMKFGGDED